MREPSLEHQPSQDVGNPVWILEHQVWNTNPVRMLETQSGFWNTNPVRMLETLDSGIPTQSGYREPSLEYQPS